MKVVLVVAAHADDEVLGCGGSIARHVANGDKVHVVYMADGVGARGGDISESLREREAAMRMATKILGASSTNSLGFPDNRMDTLPLIDIVQPLEAIIDDLQPEIIYTHHHGDLNVDHRLTNQAVMTACRPVPDSSVREILAFEVLSSTEWQVPDAQPFKPNVYVDISEFFEIKQRAIDAYSIEMRDLPHSRSRDHVLALCSHRGYSVGVDKAESFMLLRRIVK